MRRVEDFVSELLAFLPDTAGADGQPDGLAIDEVLLDLPVEVRGDGEDLQMSSPRGRLATGFDPHLGRLRVRFGRRGDDATWS